MISNSKVQFITHKNSNYDYIDSALLAMENGIDFIQIRMKHSSKEEIKQAFKKLESSSKKLSLDSNLRKSRVILDDYVGLSKELDTDGVHLGKMDMPVNHAREILGNEKIIGATANSFEDIVSSYNNGADYIGLGPFRFTKTKDNLSPILGLDGYKRIIDKCKERGINIPIYAIGGIRLEDLEDLKQTGIYGIAISSIILNSIEPKQTIKRILDIWN